MSTVGSIFRSPEIGSANHPHFEKLGEVEQIIIAVINFASNDLVVKVVSLTYPIVSRVHIEQERMKTKLNE